MIHFVVWHTRRKFREYASNLLHNLINVTRTYKKKTFMEKKKANDGAFAVIQQRQQQAIAMTAAQQ